MLAMSVKLVPVWSVTIEPRLIAVPVAATPGLVPHDEVLVAPVPPLEVALGLVAGALLLLAGGLPAGVVVLLVVLLLLQPARTPPIAMTATAAPASRERRCSYPFIGFCLLVANSKRCVFALSLGLRGDGMGLWIACDEVYVVEAIKCFAEIIAEARVR